LLLPFTSPFLTHTADKARQLFKQHPLKPALHLHRLLAVVKSPIFLARYFSFKQKYPFMKRMYFLLVTAFLSVMAIAQSGSGADVNVDITSSDSTGGGFPWLWVIGAIVFIVLLVALLGGRGRTDRVIEKKTVIRD
jgi:hypothetical protein